LSDSEDFAQSAPACESLHVSWGMPTLAGSFSTEIYHHVRISLAGLHTSPTEFALNVIQKMGSRGHFLRQQHTREHLRRQWFSDLTAQLGEGGDYRDPLEVAREKTARILADHWPEPPDEAQEAELERILAAAEEEFGR
jgi:trimethylamine:corrinoid methyltransferase-like protein